MNKNEIAKMSNEEFEKICREEAESLSQDLTRVNEALSKTAIRKPIDDYTDVELSALFEVMIGNKSVNEKSLKYYRRLVKTVQNTIKTTDLIIKSINDRKQV